MRPVGSDGRANYGHDGSLPGTATLLARRHDGLSWAVKEGYADPKKAAVFGGSYGGYAALAAVTFTPEVFACAVDIVGPSNLKTLIGAIPPYWKSIRGMFVGACRIVGQKGVQVLQGRR